MVVCAFDGKLFCTVNDTDVYALDIIPDHVEKSENFDADYAKPTPIKRHIPPMNHPWRRSSFQRFAACQAHHLAQAASF